MCLSLNPEYRTPNLSTDTLVNVQGVSLGHCFIIPKDWKQPKSPLVGGTVTLILIHPFTSIQTIIREEGGSSLYIDMKLSPRYVVKRKKIRSKQIGR